MKAASRNQGAGRGRSRERQHRGSGINSIIRNGGSAGRPHGNRGGASSSNHRATVEPTIATEAWLEAIEQATAVLRDARDVPSPTSNSFGRATTRSHHDSSAHQESLFQRLDASKEYLDRLESKLKKKDLNKPPTAMPPIFDPNRAKNLSASPTGVASVEDATAVPHWRFSLPEDYYSDSSSSEEEEDEDSSQDGQPAPQDRPTATTSESNNAALSRRRLLIRIVTSLSELYACRASRLPPQWKEGAKCYQDSLKKIHDALNLVDTECANTAKRQSAMKLYEYVPPSDLEEDAEIVSVAIVYLTTERDKFRQKVVAQEQYLLRRLRPQWQTRDAVRAMMGEDRWTNNPNPSRRYAQQRRDDERQLRALRSVLQDLDGLDTATAQASARQLRERVRNRRATTGQQNGTAQQQQQQEQQQERHRYNGKRPTDLSQRVSLVEYPDATEFGWTFTGSNSRSRVEFFERANQNDVVHEEDVVKLDWYYTTATVKTSLHHPVQGKTQLFGKRVSPKVYRQVLTNPRAHTNVRYQHT